MTSDIILLLVKVSLLGNILKCTIEKSMTHSSWIQKTGIVYLWILVQLCPELASPWVVLDINVVGHLEQITFIHKMADLNPLV